MRAKIIIVLFVASVGIVGAQAFGNAKIRVKESVFSCGEINNLRKFKHSFIIENNVSSPLEISRVDSSCACTNVVLSKKIIPENEKINLEVTVDPRRKIGPLDEQILLTSNDTEKQYTQLKIIGKVIETISVRPTAFYLGKSPYDTVVKKSVKIEPLEDGVEVVNVTCASQSVKVEMVLQEDRTSYEINIIAIPPFPLGEFHSTVFVETNSTSVPEFEIPIHGTFVSDLTISPSEIALVETEDKSNSVSRFLHIGPGKIKNFNITEIELPADIEYTVTPVGKNGFLIKLSKIIPDLVKNQYMYVYTDAPNAEKISIPFVVK